MMPQLVGEVVARQMLSSRTINEMVRLFDEHYEVSCVDNFLRDLREKNQIILLRDAECALQGFSTLSLYHAFVEGREVGVVYSGDTIIRPAYWGTPALPSLWIKQVLAWAAQMPQPVYWLLISSGYKSYRFLPVFYRDFYPRFDCSTPLDIQSTMDALACAKFGSQYDAATGIVRFRDGGTPLRAGVAELGEERLRNPHIAYFVSRNPGHAQGDELVCLTQISWENLTSAGRRMAS